MGPVPGGGDLESSRGALQNRDISRGGLEHGRGDDGDGGVGVLTEATALLG